MQSICVFCGSSKGRNPKFAEMAYQLGVELAERNIKLVYGGGKIGLMGEVANASLQNGGQVTGIIPKFLAKKEIAHEGITELITVESMHARKLKMSELADGFIVLPGGYGTLEELCEMLTWVQLSLINKPIGILNIDGFFDHLYGLFDTMVKQELLKQSNLKFSVQSQDITDLLSKMQQLSTEVSSFKDKFIHT